MSKLGDIYIVNVYNIIVKVPCYDLSREVIPQVNKYCTYLVDQTDTYQ